MKISKNSWHYRFNKWADSTFDFGKVFTTCSYIRHTLWAMTKEVVGWTAIAAILCGIAFCIGFYLYASGYTIYSLYTGVIGNIELFKFGSAMMVFTALFAAATGLACLIKRAAHALEKREMKVQAGLLAQAKQDRKDGICTLVEFE